MKQQQAEAEKHNRTYAYAETYEDFIKMIQESSGIEDLQRLRLVEFSYNKNICLSALFLYWSLIYISVTAISQTFFLFGLFPWY